ncbi:SRPBCC family protein [Citricoccus sp. NR2]|uniref:SRPBCC family protein n=1 Tax=Citricoccus sp. NR2 TaxID=3004095 RepID=UPI0022DDF8F3|nr:SRPBCC domain-containing protein [Citricoccus sp. NR2]WBL19254.1 SRPBCC domain-containing protein [Citricoccus sp. NR2]
MTDPAESISTHIDVDDEHCFMEVSVDLPATPEAVWESVATGPGYRRWFVEAEIDGRVGGALITHHGDFGASHGTIVEWEPHRRYRYLEADWMGEEQPVPPWETEIVLTPVGEDGTVTRATLRSGISAEGATWKDAILGTQEGWEGAWLNLLQFHAHFGDRHAAQALVMRAGGPDDDIVTTLGLVGAVVGEERGVSNPAPSGAGGTEQPGGELLRGTVIATTDSLSDQDATSRSVMLRTTDAVYEFGTLLMGGERTLVVRGYLYPEASRGLSAAVWESQVAEVGSAARRRWETVVDDVVAPSPGIE